MNNWNKKNVKNINNWQITCASDAEEFFYEDTNEVVPEGEMIGIEVEESNNIDLVLFSNIYWSDKNLY
jgi:hypothetical protein